MAKAKKETEPAPASEGTGPIRAPAKQSDFTPRTRKVLHAACHDDGYAYDGSEQRAVKLLKVAGLVEITGTAPQMRCQATEAGQAVSKRWQAENSAK